MRCSYFDAGVCRSCTFLDQPYPAQVAAKQARCAEALASVGAADVGPVARVLAEAGASPRGADTSHLTWLEPWANRPFGFRNRAKMVVAGTAQDPTLGILDPTGRGIDLRACPLHEQPILDALPHVADLIRRCGLQPYDVPRRRGELKHVLVTVSPDGELMLRFVLRSERQLPQLTEHLPRLLDALPHLRVVTANILPEHKAVLEGEREIHLAGETTLPMRIDHLTLHLRPQGFFQTCTDAAAALYRQAAAWVDDAAGAASAPDSHPFTIWDLYCGVGGFGLFAAGSGRRVGGVETSAAAVAAATRTAGDLGLPAGAVEFVAADATAWVREQAARGVAPDLVVLNPPRRGIGAELCAWIEDAPVGRAIYSSCHLDSLVADLRRMPSWTVRTGRLVDMFPHTAHQEVIVELVRS